MSPLAVIDSTLSPMILAANRVRQVRDALPVSAWQFVPATIRVPLDELFQAVEAWDSMIGRLKQAGLVGDDVG